MSMPTPGFGLAAGHYPSPPAIQRDRLLATAQTVGAMTDKTFSGICKRFFGSLAWCCFMGLLSALLYRVGNPTLRQTIEKALGEHAAPITFNALGVLSLFCLGTTIALFGRTKQPISIVRWFVCYRPAELSLSVAAVFFGLWGGFSLGLLPAPGAKSIAAVTAVALAVTVGTLLFMIKASFEGGLRWAEASIRAWAVALSAVNAFLFWWTYVR